MSTVDPIKLNQLARARMPRKREAPTGHKKGKKPATPEEKEQAVTLDEWFLARDKEATGKCKHCGGRTCKGDPLYYKHSVCHILPKRLFPSVATHPLNCIELCFWGNNCHANMDNNILDLTDMNCWNEIVEKFQKMYSAIDPKERRHIPDVLLQYVEAS